MNIENEYIAIYELNNRSPLFARVASDAIENGNFGEAISILEQGLELFDNYPTAYFLLGKALQKIEKPEEAEKCIEKGELLLSEFSNHSATSEVYNNDNVTEEIIEETAELEDDSDDLEELADRLKVAKIEVNHDEPVVIPEENTGDFKPLKGLVSETLANIYFNQANYKEAKAIYETLVEIQPERKDYFEKRIAEVESHMRGQ